jgi:hypothetical protein
MVLGGLAVLAGCSPSGSSSDPSADVTEFASVAPSWFSLSASEICDRVSSVMGDESLGAPIDGAPIAREDEGGLRFCTVGSVMLTSPEDELRSMRSGYGVYVSDPSTDYFQSETLPQINLDAEIANSDGEWPAECDEGTPSLTKSGGAIKSSDSSVEAMRPHSYPRAWAVNDPDYILVVVNRPTWLGDYSASDFMSVVDDVLQSG